MLISTEIVLLINAAAAACWEFVCYKGINSCAWTLHLQNGK